MPLEVRWRRCMAASLLASICAVAVARAADFPISYETAPRGALKAAPRAVHAPFSDLEDVDGVKAGLLGDGSTDNTETFRKIFSKPGVHVSIARGDYRTGRFVIMGNTWVQLETGVTIRDTGQLGPNQPLVQVYGSHVRISARGARVVQKRSDYTTDQGRHGVSIVGVSDVLVEGLESSDTGGDGFYIGGAAGKPATNVTLLDCAARNNRRQGLSIINARNVDVIHSSFTGTNGARPEGGIDLEPNYKTDVLDKIYLFDVTTADNRGGGILMYLNPLSPASEPVKIEIIGHRSSGESALVAVTADKSVGGTVRYVRLR